MFLLVIVLQHFQLVRRIENQQILQDWLNDLALVRYVIRVMLNLQYSVFLLIVDLLNDHVRNLIKFDAN